MEVIMYVIKKNIFQVDITFIKNEMKKKNKNQNNLEFINDFLDG